MEFGPVPIDQAEGAVLAHSLKVSGHRFKKGLTLTAQNIADMIAAGVDQITVAQVGQDDVAEDEAAALISAAIASGTTGLSLSAPFTGRANIFADQYGVLCVNREAIDVANQLDEAITIATMPDQARIAPRQMLATVKIIPYAAPADAVAEAIDILSQAAVLTVHPRTIKRAAVFLTRTPGMKASLVEKGAAAVMERLAALGVSVDEPVVTDHQIEALSGALKASLTNKAELTVILGGSATADRRDVAPAAVEAAGGRVEHFGMPVDPGNLLFVGELNGAPVVGLPGCARSPKLNGADWVLERLVSGLAVGKADIQAMGVGGLLKEIPSRPQPRVGTAPAVSARPFVSAVLLAAGSSSRMGGADKLIMDAGEAPLIRRAAEALTSADVDEVIVVTRRDDEARRDALDGVSGLRFVENLAAAEGMGASIRAGMTAVDPAADAVLISLADMPDIRGADINRLIAGYSVDDGREIIRAATESGTPGNPVLFGRRFFELLATSEGDEGARRILAAHADLIEFVRLSGEAAKVDLDTPEDWKAWRGED
jgi:molybdenum cofactor cytidylyltransferase